MLIQLIKLSQLLSNFAGLWTRVVWTHAELSGGLIDGKMLERRRPYKAEVIGSNPIAPTFSSNYRFAGGHGSEYQIKKSRHSVKGFFHISRNPSVTGGSALRECVSRVK